MEANFLKRVPYISYLVQFKWDHGGVIRELIDPDSEVNAITPECAAQLGLSTQSTGISAPKIDGLVPKTNGIIIAGFLIKDKLSKIRFFEELFLSAHTGMKIVIEMIFLAFRNADIPFYTQSFTRRINSSAETLAMTRRVELINKD